MIPNRRAGWAVMGVVAAAVAAATVGLAVAQGTAAKGKAAVKPARGKARVNAPQAKEKDQAAARPPAAGTFHFRVKLHAFDDTTLVTSYYPSRLDTNSPAVMLVHEKERSSKDFEDPIDELKKLGLAEHLQSLGYAVLTLDLRGHGANARRAVSDREWAEMVDDLQAAYQFLLDRHNRGELNLAKLGVVGLGEGANLAAAWAYLPGGGVSTEGRVTDIAGLVLISPLPKGLDLNFTTMINTLAPRVPVLLMAGERDALSHEAVKRVRANVEKVRQNRVELFPSSLHGYKLLKLEPRATSVITRFLESTVKLKSAEWEPRFNLTPVVYTDIEVIRHATKAAEKDKDNAKARAKEKDAAPGARAMEKDAAPKPRGPADARKPGARSRPTGPDS